MKASTAPIEVPAWECIELLESERLGRICFVDDGGTPIALAVNYAVTKDGAGSTIVVFRASPTSSIARVVGPASFEVDRIEPDCGRAWSVLVRGRLRKADGPGNLPDSKPWASVGRHQWMTLELSSISGRRFVPSEVDDGFSVEWQSDEG